MANGRATVGTIGSQFEADIHAASLQIMPHEAEVVAIASPTPRNAAKPVFTDSRFSKNATSKGAARPRALDEQRVVLEVLTGIQRAGASMILTYHAKDVARWLKHC